MVNERFLIDVLNETTAFQLGVCQHWLAMLTDDRESESVKEHARDMARRYLELASQRREASHAGGVR